MTHNETVGRCHVSPTIAGRSKDPEWWEKKCKQLNKEDCEAKKACYWKGGGVGWR